MPFGFITNEDQVNTTPTGNQRSAATAALANGGYVTVWASDTGDGSGKAIMGQRFAADGTKVGAEFLVNTTTAGDQDLPDVVAYNDVNSSGGAPYSFIVVWQSAEAGGSVIRGRRFLEDGTPIRFKHIDPAGSPDTDAIVSGALGGSNPSAGIYGSGRLAIVWEAPSGDGNGTAIAMAQYRFGLSNPIIVNTTTAGNQINPRIADSSLVGGGSIAWESQEPGGDVIRGRILSQGAGFPGGDVVLSEALSEDESLPNVAEGGTLVIWNSGTNIVARDLDYGPGGSTAVGSSFILNTTPGGVISRSDIIGFGDGNYAVAYFTQAGDDGSSYSIRTEYFNRTAGPQSAEFLVPQSFAGAQEGPTIVRLNGGNIVITWASEADALGNFEIKQRLLRLDATGGTTGDDTLNGTAGDDVLNGLGGNDSINGLGGNDLIDGGPGNDVMDGGDGTDTLTYAASTVPVTISLAAGGPQPNGDAGTDTLANFENLIGSRFADTLTGTDGANVIDGGAGADSMTGGDGDDIYYVGDDVVGDTVVEAAGGGTDEVRVALAIFSLHGTNIENLTATTNAFYSLRGSAANNVVTSGGGHDLLLLQDGGNDTALGGGGNDVLYFGAAYTTADAPDGGAGTDVLILQGTYTITLGANTLTGFEALSLQSGSVTFWGDTANNRYDYNITTVNSNVLLGAQLIVNGQSLLAGEDLTFDGSAETDGAFILYAGHGVDTLKGGANGDVFFFEGTRWSATDTVDGAGGADVLVISAGTGINRYEFLDTSFVNIEAISVSNRFTSDPRQKPSYELVLANGNVTAGQSLIVNGNSLDSTQTISIDGLAVQAGNLTLYGGAGNDTLRGGGAADLLYGGGGADQLTGYLGADIFRYDSVTESMAGAADLILDFVSMSDKIDLSRIDANTHAAGDQGFSWIGSNAFGASGPVSAGELRIFQANGQWRVEGDTNGDGNADFAILFQAGTPAPVQSDFLL